MDFSEKPSSKRFNLREIIQKIRQQIPTNAEVPISGPVAMSDISKRIYENIPDGINIHPIVAEKLPKESIQLLQNYIRYYMSKMRERYPSDREIPIAQELAREEKNIEVSILRIAEILTVVPEISQLLDLQVAKARGILDEKVLLQHMERIKESLAKKYKIEFQFHRNQNYGFNKAFEPDPKSSNHAKVLKESDGTWVIITNELSHNNPFEIAHEIYGHLLEKPQLPSDYDTEEEYIQAKGREYFDTRTFDALFTRGVEFNSLIDGDTLLGNLRNNIGRLRLNKYWT